MPVFFVVSDIHSYFDELITALNEKGFDPANPNHYLIGCGDYFDRGPKPVETMRYLRNLPRKILIRGNHEELLEDCCYRGIYYMYDISNGTYNTICQISETIDPYFPEQCDYTLKATKLFREQMVNFFETKNYIFVHSWIPVNKKLSPPYYTFLPNWREANNTQWKQASWGNPYELIKLGLLPDKTVVFGHWHCSAGWALAENRSEFGEDSIFDPFYGDGYISIDGCTAYTKKVNIVVLEDEFI